LSAFRLIGHRESIEATKLCQGAPMKHSCYTGVSKALPALWSALDWWAPFS